MHIPSLNSSINQDLFLRLPSFLDQSSPSTSKDPCADHGLCDISSIQTLEALCDLARVHMVAQMVTQITGKVRPNNRVFVTANRVGSGVRKIPEQILFSANKEMEQVRQHIIEKFSVEFTPVKIIDTMQNILSDQLSFKGYVNGNPSGYARDVCCKFEEHIRIFFNLPESKGHVFIVLKNSDHSIITDINWREIRKQILFTLIEKKYLLFDSKEYREALLVSLLLEDPHLAQDFFAESPYVKGVIKAIDAYPRLAIQLAATIFPIAKKSRDSAAILQSAEKSNVLIPDDQYCPRSVEFLCQHILRLSVEHRADVLKQITYDGYNALMLAARHHPKSLESLCKLIDKFSVEDRQAILKQTTSDGYNALMLAARHHPQSVEPLCKSIENLSVLDKSLILKQITDRQWNTLMLAARHHPQFIELLCFYIAKLPVEGQVDMLKQANPAGCSPQSVLGQLVGTGSAEDRVDILEQTTFYGYNALMLAVRYQPKSVESLFQLITSLPRQDQREILSQKSVGVSAVQLIKKCMPTAWGHLSLLVDQITSERKETVHAVNGMPGYNYGSINGLNVREKSAGSYGLFKYFKKNISSSASDSKEEYIPLIERNSSGMKFEY